MLLLYEKNEEKKKAQESLLNSKPLEEDFLGERSEVHPNPPVKEEESFDLEEEIEIKEVKPNNHNKHSPLGQDEEDPLDQYMNSIEKDVEMQDYQIQNLYFTSHINSRLQENQDDVCLNLPQEGYEDPSKVITMEEIFNEDRKSQTDADEEEYYNEFIQCVKGSHIEPEGNKNALVLWKEDANEEFNEDGFEDIGEKWLRAKRQLERKEIKIVDHSKINYDPLVKDLYVEVPEISNLSEEEVAQFRKDNDEIKVKGRNIPRPISSWYQCGFSDNVLKVIEHKGLRKPFPIQCQAIPVIMSGRDMIGIAETGSGKTLAYVLPMLRHILVQRPLKVISYNM